MSAKSGFAWRAFVAVALFIGFYVLVFGTLALIAGIFYVEIRTQTFSLLLSAVAGLAGFSLLRSAFWMRSAPFVPPGPELLESDQPELFAALRDIATIVGADIPDRVFVAPGVQACVGRVGGVAGIGAKRVLMLGAGLLSLLEVSQIKAIVAHELGHYVGGELKLGPFIYGARERLIAVVGSLRRGIPSGYTRLLTAPFLAYGKLFFRVSHAISREQELAADRLGARVVGPRCMAEVLGRVGAADLLFDHYLEDDLGPLLAFNFFPQDIYEAFERSAERRQRLRGPQIEAALKERETDPYDTHPSYRDRVAHLEALPDKDPEIDRRPARALFRDFDRLRDAVSASLRGRVQTAKTVPFDEAAPEAFARAIKQKSDAAWSKWQGLGFTGATYLECSIYITGALGGDALQWGAALVPEFARVPVAQREQLRPLAEAILVDHAEALFGSELLARGGSLTKVPGSPCTVALGEARFPLFCSHEWSLDSRAALANLREQFDKLHRLPSEIEKPTT